MDAPENSPRPATPSRRGFLTSQLPQKAAEKEPILEGTAEFLFQATRRIMACDFQVTLDAEFHPTGPETAMAALDIVDQLEAELSVYRESSQVSQLNQLAAREPMSVDSPLFQLLEQCLELWKQTDGAFDITSTPLSRAWGFYRREGRMPSSEEVSHAQSSVGSQWMKLDKQNCTVHFENPRLEINLGSIGKGHALDRCAAWLAADVGDFIIHGGYSSILARGNRQTTGSGQEGWKIAVRHPLKPRQRLIELTLKDCAAGTSGSANQFFYHEGKRFSHVLDPRTGWPAEDLLSVTVLCPTAAEADALATAFFVMGIEQTTSYVADHPHVRAVLVCPGKRSGATDVHLVGLAPGSWELLSEAVTLVDHGQVPGC